MVDSPSSGTSKRRKCWHLYFDNQAFTDLWKTMIEKIKSSSSSTTNGQRIAETSERAKMQKWQKCRKKKERKKEREKEEEEEEEEEEMEMQAHGLPASHRGWEVSTMVVRVKKKFIWGCS